MFAIETLLLPGMPVPIVIANVAMVSTEPHFGVCDRKQNLKFVAKLN